MIEPRPFLQPAVNPECRESFRKLLIDRMSAPMRVPRLMPAEYRNPFDFMNEHDQWFEFLRRKYFGGESTYNIIRDMLSDDIPRASRAADVSYSSARLDADRYAGKLISERRALFYGGSA